MTNVPPQYQGYVNSAASALGISPAIVAAQINEESGFNPHARSSAGAEGIAQFLPSTFRSYGTGSPFNPADAFNAYTNYMRSLLHQFNGNITNALAAYNAGPGNISAGMGYARTILGASGSGVSLTAANNPGGGDGSGGGWSWWNFIVNDFVGHTGGNLNPSAGALEQYGTQSNPINNLVDTLQSLATFFAMLVHWFALPNLGMRLVAGTLGSVFLISGIYLFATGS